MTLIPLVVGDTLYLEIGYDKCKSTRLQPPAKVPLRPD
jgi:hypothetical protein